MKTLLSIIILLSTAVTAKGQSRILSPDSLLGLLQKYPPFEVLRKINFERLPSPKDLYYNKELKPYLLQWLNGEEYKKHVIRQEIEYFATQENSIRGEIQYKLRQQNREQWLDSILANPGLYAKYRDSSIADRLAYKISRRKEQKYYPPGDAISFHSWLAYPESYKIIRQYWEETGKFVRKDYFETYFSALVVMGDPEARRLFDKEIAELTKSNGGSEDDLIDFNGFFGTYQDNSYVLNKMLETLRVNHKYVRSSDGDPIAFNCLVVNRLVSQLLYYSIPIGAKIHNATPCEEKLKYEKELREAVQKLIKKREEEERYWMENMPFYKK